MSGSKVKLVISMMLGEWRALPLYYSLPARLFQVVTSGLGGEGLVGDGAKGLSNLDSIFSLPRVDQASSMAQVGISELLWTATRGFRAIVTVLGPLMGDSVNTNGSDGVDFMSRFARINEGEKIFNLCG